MFPEFPWTCPKCGKSHSKVHFAHPGQVDESKNPLESGRVKFNREWGKGSACDADYKRKDDTPIKTEFKDSTGPAKDPEGYENGRFCPHCGFLEEVVHVVKVKKK